jgi:hypothetical protein
MTLNEAITSGKAFTRPLLRDVFGFFKAEDIGVDVVLSGQDIVATDYILEPSEFTVSAEEFAQAWDESARLFNNVKLSNDSKLFAALLSKLTGV